MPNELPLPRDLQHLIEKREGDRRSGDDQAAGGERRAGNDRRGQGGDHLAGEPIDGPAEFTCGLCGHVIRFGGGTHALPVCGCDSENGVGWYTRNR